MDLKKFLPQESFLTFEAAKILHPQLHWENPNINSKLALENYAFLIPTPENSGNLALEEKALLLGERYGGTGLGTNGGGVRCGLYGGQQIKGIGQNALAGKFTDKFHSYGGASLHEAILEAIWGEITNLALPYGGARCQGIIGTGIEVPRKFPRTGERATTPGALTVRQPMLRAGHFMRSIYIDSRCDTMSGSIDAKRTEWAIKKLYQDPMKSFGYGGSEGLTPTTKNSIGYSAIDNWLSELLQRFAFQLAAARAKRIMHGSFTGSNTSIAGSWLDFGSISRVSDYGRLLLPRGAPDFMHEEDLFKGEFVDLCYYLSKYAPAGLPRFIDAVQHWKQFNNMLASRLQTEFVALLGIPAGMQTALPRNALSRLFTIMNTLMLAGNSEPLAILSHDNDYVPTMPKKMGTFHLNSILLRAARFADAPNLHSRMTPLIPDATLRSDFVGAYIDIVNAYKHQFCHQQNSAAEVFRQVHSFRLNLPFAAAYRTVLYPAIEQKIEAQYPVDAYINSLVDTARVLVSNSTEEPFRLNEIIGRNAFVSLRDGLVINDSTASAKDLKSGLQIGKLHTVDIDAADIFFS